MAKEKTAAKPKAGKAAKEPKNEGLRALTFEMPTEDGKTEQVGIDIEMQETLTAVEALDNVLAPYLDTVEADEGLLAHGFYAKLASIAEDGHKQLRPRLLEIGLAAPEGKVETELGVIAATQVAATTERRFTEATVAMLESHKLLPQAVEMQATMKVGVNVEEMPEADLDTIRKYFEVELIPSAAKIEGLVQLGKLKAKDVEATVELVPVRAGHPRLTVKPSKQLAEAFGLPVK